MSAASVLNPNNELARKLHALLFNITAAKGLQGIVTSNLGPRGTLKMCVTDQFVLQRVEWANLATPSGSEAPLSPTKEECISNLMLLCSMWRYRLVSAGGDIKITKDGQILLKEVVRRFLCFISAPFSRAVHSSNPALPQKLVSSA